MAAESSEYRSDRVTLLACHNRKSGMSIEEFRIRWRQHAKVFMSMKLAQQNILKYEQLHPNIERAKGLPFVLPYDGVVIFEAKSYDHIMEIFASQEYKEKVVPDEETFVDRSSVALLPCDMVTAVSKN